MAANIPSRTPRIRRAVIVGGSMGGLFAALLLRQIGWDAQVYERTGSELASRGAGIVTHAELFDILRDAGIDAGAASVGVSVKGRRILSPDGGIAGELALPQILTSWGHLYGLLRAALPDDCYHHGAGLTGLEEREDRVVARFADGRTAEGDLLVGADGIGSSVRRLLLSGVEADYVGYIAWRGLVEEAVLSYATRAALCDTFTFALPEGEQMLGYPVAGANETMEPGRRRFNYVWYRPAARGPVLDGLLTDVDGTTHALSIPPDRIRPETLTAMRADARRLLAPQFAEVVEKTGQPFIQAIQDLAVPRMVLGRRTVIIGDAAFVARPHVGMGVTKAAADARALTAALAARSDDLPAALHAFEAKRLPAGATIIRRARELGAYMQAQILSAEERALAERHRQPDAVMRETAVATGITA